MPRLIDFKANIKHKYYNTNTETIIHSTTPQKQNKLYISPQFGIGFGLYNKKPDVYIGFGIGYNW